ncbi:MAG TPA: hypothetical protein VJQ79_00030 [Acidimicrobiia bacterium]|nr:hypothetical protein [Acidimicrobiia bacterium]
MSRRVRSSMGPALPVMGLVIAFCTAKDPDAAENAMLSCGSVALCPRHL